MFEKLNHISLFDQRLAASFVSFSLTLKIIVVSVDLSSRRCYHLSISTPRSSRLDDYRDSTSLGTSRSFGEDALRLPSSFSRFSHSLNCLSRRIWFNTCAVLVCSCVHLSRVFGSSF